MVHRSYYPTSEVQKHPTSDMQRDPTSGVKRCRLILSVTPLSHSHNTSLSRTRVICAPLCFFLDFSFYLCDTIN